MQKKKAKKYAGLRDEQFSLVEHYARQHGINSKFLLVFTWIYNNPEGITQEFICKRTYSSKQVIQSIVKNHMRKGWLYLEAIPNDKRRKLIRMTELGAKEIAALVEPLNIFEAKAMSALTKEQQKAFLEATQIFTETFKELIESYRVGS
jgi:DNA-binding MarR family transcriptional regulator